MISVKLNTDEHGMCFIGKYVFNFSNEGPVNIDVKQLTPDELNKFIYNYRRGVLFIDNVAELLKSAPNAPASSNHFATGKENPVQRYTDPHSLIEEEELALKKLLRSKIGDIKDTVAVMSPAKVKKLVELEKATKNRKKLLNYLENILLQHQQSVTKRVGTKDAQPIYADVNLMIDRQYLDNISNVVESEVEQMVLNPMSVEE